MAEVAAQSSEFDPAEFAMVLLVTLVVMILIGRIVYRDVEKRNGDGAKVVVALVLFWPLGLYWWHKARSEFDGRRWDHPMTDRERALQLRVSELEAELRKRAK